MECCRLNKDKTVNDHPLQHIGHLICDFAANGIEQGEIMPKAAFSSLLSVKIEQEERKLAQIPGKERNQTGASITPPSHVGRNLQFNE